MAKVQDTYNPVTGEYVKRISDWTDLDGSKGWVDTVSLDISSKRATIGIGTYNINFANWLNVKSILTDYTSKQYTYQDAYMNKNSFNFHTNSGGSLNINIQNTDTGFSETMKPTSGDWKAYFYGWRMCNSDSTSPYYKSEVPYTPETWAEWQQGNAGVTFSPSGITITGSLGMNTVARYHNYTFKSSSKYGLLYNVTSSNITSLFLGGGINGGTIPVSVGNNKSIQITRSDIDAYNYFGMYTGSGNSIVTLKDFRLFELPAGSQIEADFTNLSADELSAKYTFNGLCVKHWKKLTDGTGLTSTLPTASYAGYTPYRMIYQLATPEISYLTPKATIPLYDTNTIVETDTPSDCKADVTVGYKLKSGATAIAGDITAPTPDYMSAVNSVSEDGLKKGIVRSPNVIENGNFANGATGWGAQYGTIEIINGVAVATANGATNGSRIYSTTPIQTNVGDILYMRSKCRVTNASATNLHMFFNDGVINKYATIANPTSNTWYTPSLTVNIQVSGESNKSYFYQQYGDNPTATGKKMEVDEVTLVNLTASFGAGNEPTKEQCDILFATWQDKASTQATLPTLRKIGTVADTYNPETGVLVQRIGKKVLRDTDIKGLSIIANGANNIATTPDPISPAPKSKAWDALMPPFYSTHFTNMTNPATTAFDLVNTDKACISTNGGLWLSLDKTKITNLAEAKEWVEQQYASGTPIIFYYELATPVVTTLATTALPTYKPTTVIESDSTIKGNISADYKLKVGATPVAGDFIASPESVNDIKDLGNSIDVVSSIGRRNLITDSSTVRYTTRFYTVHTYAILKNMIGKTITLSFDMKTHTGGFLRNILVYPYQTSGISISGDKTVKNNSFDTWERFSMTTTVKDWGIKNINLTLGEIGFYDSAGTNSYSLRNFKIEEAGTSSAYTPAPTEVASNQITNGVYKTNILLGAPLRSVKAVKDRLFKDSDGKWKVERNIGEKIFDGVLSSVSVNAANADGFRTIISTLPASTEINENKNIKCSHFEITGLTYKTYSLDALYLNYIYLYAPHSFLGTSGLNTTSEIAIKFNEWIKEQYTNGTPLTIQYQLATPTYETLSQELQTKLDNIPTFPEHNYVYTVTNDNLQPMLHVDYKKLSWLKSRLLVNSLKIYSRNLTNAEMIQNYKVEKERFGM